MVHAIFKCGSPVWPARITTPRKAMHVGRRFRNVKLERGVACETVCFSAALKVGATIVRLGKKRLPRWKEPPRNSATCPKESFAMNLCHAL